MLAAARGQHSTLHTDFHENAILPGTGVKIALAAARFRDFGVARQGPSTVFLLRVDGTTYFTSGSASSGNIFNDEDLGPLFAEVNRKSTSSTTKDQAASNVVPVYAVKGYDTSFRLAARMGDDPLMFEAFFNPKANEASDVLDIGGKVSSIGFTHWLGPEGGRFMLAA